MLGFHPTRTFRTTGTAKLSALHTSCTLQKLLGTYFLLEAEWTPELLNMDRRNMSLENLRGPYQESNAEAPVLWHSKTNCATAHPLLYLAHT
jgi:hypothetical protein